MSDGKTEAMRGTYFNSKSKNVSTTGEVKHSKFYYDGERNRPYAKEDIMKVKKEDLKYMPNQKKHQITSFIKSGVRITGYIFIPFDAVFATCVLILSEVIGIVEELV